MGGNLFNSPRIPAAEYHLRVPRLLAALRPLHAGRIDVIPAYRSKGDFGDMDVLVEMCDPRRDVAVAAFADALASEQVHHNGPVSSLLWDGFQVDFIFVRPEEYGYALNYFAWNDLGNLVGRVAHKIGFKHGHRGLQYVLRDNDHVIAELCVTRDHDAALRFLGYDPARFHQGFDTLEEVFRYAISTPYFSRDPFLLENRSHKARTRDRKRNTYRAFLNWLEGSGVADSFQWDADSKLACLERAKRQHPDFSSQLEQALKRHDEDLLARSRFNGNLVSGLTGLDGKELGLFMARFKAAKGEGFRDWVLGAAEQDISRAILAAAQSDRGESAEAPNRGHACMVGVGRMASGAASATRLQHMR